MYASSFLPDTAGVWSFTSIPGNATSVTWKEFRVCLKKEIVSKDHVTRPLDRLRSLRHTTSVSKQRSTFETLIISLSDITVCKKLEKFKSGLKYMIQVEILQSNV